MLNAPNAPKIKHTHSTRPSQWIPTNTSSSSKITDAQAATQEDSNIFDDILSAKVNVVTMLIVILTVIILCCICFLCYTKYHYKKEQPVRDETSVQSISKDDHDTDTTTSIHHSEKPSTSQICPNGNDASYASGIAASHKSSHNSDFNVILPRTTTGGGTGFDMNLCVSPDPEITDIDDASGSIDTLQHNDNQTVPSKPKSDDLNLNHNPSTCKSVSQSVTRDKKKKYNMRVEESQPVVIKINSKLKAQIHSYSKEKSKLAFVSSLSPDMVVIRHSTKSPNAMDINSDDFNLKHTVDVLQTLPPQPVNPPQLPTCALVDDSSGLSSISASNSLIPGVIVRDLNQSKVNGYNNENVNVESNGLEVVHEHINIDHTEKRGSVINIVYSSPSRSLQSASSPSITQDPQIINPPAKFRKLASYENEYEIGDSNTSSMLAQDGSWPTGTYGSEGQRIRSRVCSVGTVFCKNNSQSQSAEIYHKSKNLSKKHHIQTIMENMNDYAPDEKDEVLTDLEQLNLDAIESESVLDLAHNDSVGDVHDIDNVSIHDNENCTPLSVNGTEKFIHKNLRRLSSKNNPYGDEFEVLSSPSLLNNGDETSKFGYNTQENVNADANSKE